MYQYNGKSFDIHEYAQLIHEKTGISIKLTKARIRKGWPIEKLLLPNTVKRPILQYSTEGIFIKKFTHIAQALDLVKGSSSTGIKMSAKCVKSKNGDDKLSGGFIWRYADQIKDTSKKLDVQITEPYNSNPDRKYLRDRYDTIKEFCFKPNGRYYNNEKIKLWEEWANDFEKFYDDLLPLLKEARIKYASYIRRERRSLKLRNAPDTLYNDHVWFSRIDKTDGYYPWNVAFLTPEWTNRYRPNCHRVIVGGEIKFVPQIFDELNSDDKSEIKEHTIRKNVVNKEDILKHKDKKPYKYKGKYYSRSEIVEKYGLLPNVLSVEKSRLGDKTVEKLIERRNKWKVTDAGKNYKEPIEYRGKLYTPTELAKELESKFINDGVSVDVLRSRIKALKQKKTKFDELDIEKILNARKLEEVYVWNNGESVKLSELCRDKDFPYSVAWKRFKRGDSIERIFRPVSKFRFGQKPKMLFYKGKEYTIQEAAEKIGVKYNTVFYRVKNNWPVEKIFS
jgi:hypothetical protein